ncbi:MAG: hypothetical protein KDC46_06100 [Thermoleophilia bacterium]|nr:hypothetical protein [Thermoleophilia bacterium]
MPSPNAKPTVVVRALNLGPGTCTLGAAVQQASVVVFVETEAPDDVRIAYPDPGRAARIDSERASAERFTITMAIEACAAAEDMDQFDPPAKCLDLAHLRATDESMRTVRESALITPASSSYAVTVPYRLNGRTMATQETYRTDGTAIEDGDFPYP